MVCKENAVIMPRLKLFVPRRLIAGAGFALMICAGLGVPGQYARADAVGQTAQPVLPGADASLWPVRTLDLDMHVPAGSTLQLSNLSNNEQVVTGARINPRSKVSMAFRWSAQGGMQDIVIPDARNSEATWISENGALISGDFSDASGRAYGFQWSENSGLQTFGEPGWTKVQGVMMADDGAIVVGTSWHNNGGSRSQAFSWTKQDGVQQLVDSRLASLLRFTPTDTGTYSVSEYGTVIAGWAKNAQTGEWAIFRIDRAHHDVQMIARGQDARAWPEVMMLSRDGSVMFGSTSASSAPCWSLRWTQQDGLRELLPGTNSMALGMSYDGSKVLGEYLAKGQPRLFIWTEETGARDAGIYENNVQYLSTDRHIFKVRTHTP
jgi:uncharacterized membrane protein